MINPRPRVQEGPVDRLPPHALEAETGVLGCCLLDPMEAIGECVQKLGSNGDAFFEMRNQVLFRVLVGLLEQTPAQVIDLVTVQTALRDAGVWEQVGGLEYLNACMDATPSAANLGWYLEIVRGKWLLRQMQRVLVEGEDAVHNAGERVTECLDGIEQRVLAVNSREGQTGVRTMRDLVQVTDDLLERMHRGVGLIGGLRTHFGYLDKMTGGLHRKELAVLAARPSVGKTSLMMNIAVNVARRENVPVGIFSMEMSAEDLCMRCRCTDAEVNFQKLRTGFAPADALPALARRAAKMAGLPIFIDDTPALGILDLRARARRMVSQQGVGLICVDYLQLMHGRGDEQNREREVAAISGGLKGLAKDHNVAVLVLSQLNRELERAKHRKPQLADLRESGAIEQDADLVGMMYRPKTEEDEDEESDIIPVNVLIAKQRNGPTGDVELMFNRLLMEMKDKYLNRGTTEAVVKPGDGLGKIDLPPGLFS